MKSSEGKGIKRNWNNLEKIYNICKIKGVSFCLTYEESCDLFYIIINSSSKEENYITKSLTLKIAIKDTINWLNNL